jgi:plastocyanin
MKLAPVGCRGSSNRKARAMSTRQWVIVTALLGCGACAPEPIPAQAPAPMAPTTGERIAGAPTDRQPSGGRGDIVGTIATNPWHAIKSGGVVYLEDAPRESGTSLSGVLDNHDMAFLPSIVVIVAGGSVIFTNTDPVTHNVFSPDNEKWNLGEIPQNGSAVRRFDTPGNYAVLCNLHPSMIAYLVVAPTSYFARTSPEGVYAIKNVPDGTYHVTAWVPRLKPVTQAVTVGSGETTANFDLQR